MGSYIDYYSTFMHAMTTCLALYDKHAIIASEKRKTNSYPVYKSNGAGVL